MRSKNGKIFLSKEDMFKICDELEKACSSLSFPAMSYEKLRQILGVTAEDTNEDGSFYALQNRVLALISSEIPFSESFNHLFEDEDLGKLEKAREGAREFIRVADAVFDMAEAEAPVKRRGFEEHKKAVRKGFADYISGPSPDDTIN